MKTGKNRPCFLHLLLCASASVWMKREGKQMEASVTRAYKETPLYRNSMDIGDGENVVTSYPKDYIIKLS